MAAFNIAITSFKRKEMIKISFLDAKSFTYNGINSDLYNLMICWIDDKPNINTNGLKRNIESGSLNNIRLQTNTHGITFESNIEFEFYIIKKDESSFSKHDSIIINDWLTGSITPKLLYFNDNSVPFIHYYAICTSIEDTFVCEHYGKKITFKTNSPFGFMEPMERRFIVEGEETFNAYNIADTPTGFYYPKIKLSTNSTNNIIIENCTDKKSVTLNVSNCMKSDIANILIDCNDMKIVDLDTNKIIPFFKIGWNLDYSSYISTIGKYMSNIYWLRLVKGSNDIKIIGDCDITFIFEFPRKVGCL